MSAHIIIKRYYSLPTNNNNFSLKPEEDFNNNIAYWLEDQGRDLNNLPL